MKVIIAGGREFERYYTFDRAMQDLAARISEVVSGGARGADAMGERFAEVHEIPLAKFPADWKTHGKAAGHIRNYEMAQYADALIAFWDGESRGTRNMIDTALREGLEVHVYRYTA